jgi:DNA primase
MTNSPVDEIKNRLDIVEVIQGYIRLQKAGRNYRALCPFHSEKTPSFMVSPERQIWHCFGCGAGGSIFDFIMQMEGVEFGDALRILAQRAGVELKKIDPKLKTERTRLYEICHLANCFFVRQLEASQAGKNIQKYLASRGLQSKTIKDWQIGYAPNQWRALVNFLKSRGYPEEEIVKAGLAVERSKDVQDDREAQDDRNTREDRGAYDRFRDRIIFPIRDLNGVVVGFTGRENPYNPDNRLGKYINTPNTLIYDKSRILYGLDKAKLAIRKQNLCILVEGQMDVLMSHQAGFTNVVASSGTALTEQQLRILKRYTENLAMAFDMDLAGETATKRGLDLAIQFGFSAKVISLPENQDPADCLQKDASIWSGAIAAAQGLIEFYLSNAFTKNNPTTAEGKKEICKILLPVIKRIPNKIEQAHWLQEIARRLKVQEGILIEEMAKIKFPASTRESSAQLESRTPLNSQDNGSGHIDRKMTDLEEYALGLVLAHPENFREYQDEPGYLFTNADLGQIFKALKKNKAAKIESLRKTLPAHLADRVDYLVFRAEAQKNFTNDFEPAKEIRFCFNQLKNRYLRQKLNQLNLSIQEAENKQDKASLKKLTEEFNKLSKQIVL